MAHDRPRLQMLRALERKVLWLATWTIHNANHLRSSDDGLKVGGHQASSASLATIMTALYFAVLRPEDRVAVKPHASPIFHAIQYLFGHQSRTKLENFRGFGGVQSYPSRTKDVDDVDFSTGSVGLGVAQTLFSSLVQDYVRGKRWGSTAPDGRMVALIGDAEMDEGNIFEALLEGWKHGLKNTWWVVDYNRQSLDAVVREGLWARFESLFRNFGWDVVILKHGTLQRQAFAEPGGDRLRDWIDRCPNQLYAALTFQGGAAWRRRLLDDLGDQGVVTRLVERRSDEDLAHLMSNLGGHDLPSLLEAFEECPPARPSRLLHRLHDQGLRPPPRGPQGQPRGPDDTDAGRRPAAGDERPRRPCLGALRGSRHRCDGPAGLSRRRALRAAGPAALRSTDDTGAGGVGHADAADPIDAAGVRSPHA